MIRVATTTLSPAATDAANRLSLCLALVEAAGFTPCFATSYIDDDGDAFGFSSELGGVGAYTHPAHAVTLFADGTLR